jgi:hypothetical protein
MDKENISSEPTSELQQQLKGEVGEVCVGSLYAPEKKVGTLPQTVM